MIDVDGYLRRLGLTQLAGKEPSAERLWALHRAHVERIPYENLEIWLGRPTTVDAGESVARILRGRGGYCFHLNGAFALLLEALGYRVTRHVGGVQRRGGPLTGASGDHLALTVDGRWLVDVGLGDALYEPLPLTQGEYRQGPFTYGLRPSEAERGGWRFDHDGRGGFAGMDLRPGAVPLEAFVATHEHLSTSADSGFVRTATVQRRDDKGADVLRGLTLARVGETVTRTVLQTQPEYFAALGDLFGLTLGDVTAAERAALWRRLVTAHEQWSSGA
jgi:N-hydroxyarylamine O-acetyltransferase